MSTGAKINGAVRRWREPVGLFSWMLLVFEADGRCLNPTDDPLMPPVSPAADSDDLSDGEKG